MFPSEFTYEVPSTVQEAIQLMDKYGFDARVLAGGHSLLPMMKLRIAAPETIIDINGLNELKGWEYVGESLRIGAVARQSEIENDLELRHHFPLLSLTADRVADPLIRNRGTIIGSLVHADPASDWGATVIALKARIEIQGVKGTRTVPADEFFIDTFATDLTENELATAMYLPTPKHTPFSRYLKLERKAGDFAIVGLAVHVELTEEGNVSEAGLGICACGPTPLRAREAEEILMGQTLTDETIEKASLLVTEGVDPADDLRGTAAYKKDMLRIFTVRALREIADEWKEGVGME